MSRVCPYNLRSCIIYIILCDHTYFSPLNIAVLLTLYPTFKFPLSFLCLNHFTSNHKSAVIFNFHFFNANKHRCNHHALTSADHPSTWRWVNVNRLLHLSSLFLCQHLDYASISTFLSFFLSSCSLNVIEHFSTSICKLLRLHCDEREPWRELEFKSHLIHHIWLHFEETEYLLMSFYTFNAKMHTIEEIVIHHTSMNGKFWMRDKATHSVLLSLKIKCGYRILLEPLFLLW